MGIFHVSSFVPPSVDRLVFTSQRNFESLSIAFVIQPTKDLAVLNLLYIAKCFTAP